MKNLLKIDLNPNRIYGLDILRALAILFVLMHHTETLIPKERFKYIEPFLYDGVGVFFVLSGFLIGGILIKVMTDGKFTCNKLISFWLRRWFRTLPNYLLILTLLVLLNLFFNKNFIFFEHISYFFFSQNLFNSHPQFFPEAWSLSVEEWFYLLIPSILFALSSFRKFDFKKKLLLTSLLIIISITVYRYFKFLNLENQNNYGLLFARQVFTRLDGLMYGVLAAYLHFYNNDLWNKYRKAFLFFGVFFLIIFKIYENYYTNTLYYCAFSFSITSITTLLFLPFLSNLKKGHGTIYKSITYISLISYSIYLINFSLVKFWILNNIDLSFIANINGYLYLIVKISIYWFLTIILSVLLYKYFEIPTTKIRDKITGTNKVYSK